MPLLDYHSETVFLLCFIELSQVFHKDATSIGGEYSGKAKEYKN